MTDEHPIRSNINHPAGAETISQASPRLISEDSPLQLLLHQVIDLGWKLQSPSNYLFEVARVTLIASGCRKIVIRYEDAEGRIDLKLRADGRHEVVLSPPIPTMEKRHRRRSAIAAAPLDRDAGDTMAAVATGGPGTGVMTIHGASAAFRGMVNGTALKDIARIIFGMATHHRTRHALGERVKELSCLYGISRLTQEPNLSVDAVIRKAVEMLPPAWRFPEVTHGRIVIDGRVYTTRDFKEGVASQRADIIVKEQKRGSVEVFYTEEMTPAAEGPFLREERNLIEGVAAQLALYLNSLETAEARARLQEQLLHADRLATIGQLAAGVAHELNEPLSSILGFVQLSRRAQELPPVVYEDLEKITFAVLYARDVIRKLMVFARQTSSSPSEVDLNQLIVDGLFIFEARAAKAGVKLVRDFGPSPITLLADKTQLNQVLINLVVNALQAMPDGGLLTLRTRREGEYAILQVADTGHGMTDEVKEKIFLPFFTTKDVNQGTGLGLAIVHGIVTAHKGKITVESKSGEGATFTLRLPRLPLQEL